MFTIALTISLLATLSLAVPMPQDPSVAPVPGYAQVCLFTFSRCHSGKFILNSPSAVEKATQELPDATPGLLAHPCRMLSRSVYLRRYRR